MRELCPAIPPGAGAPLALSLIRQVLGVAAPGAVDLALGEPTHPPPLAALAALRATSPADLRYAPNAGLAELRQAVAAHRGLHGGDGGSVVITAGSQQALALAVLGLATPGDEVVIPEVCYPSYEALARLAGAAVRRVAWDGLEAAARPGTRLVVLGSPSNPTGQVLPRARLAVLLERAALCGAWVVVDEIYAPLLDAGWAARHRLPSAAERLLLVGGVSKAYALTGLRVGWLVAPPPVVKRLLPLHQHLVTCASRPAQRAAAAALADGEPAVAAARATYAARRRQALAALAAIPGLAVAEPEGGLYLWIDARRRLGHDTLPFALAQARAGAVLVVPGEAFGPLGAGFLRLSVAAEEAAIAEGVERLRSALDGWPA